MNQTQRHRDDKDDPDAAPRKMVCSENYEPVRKHDFVKITPSGSMPVTDTGIENSSVYSICNIINFVTPEKPSPEMLDLMKSMTSMGNKK